MLNNIEPEKLPEFSEIWQQTLNWQPNQLQLEQFQQLYSLILAGNQKLNLTRITAATDFWEKHLWDSLAPLINLELIDSSKPQKTIDIGTGAGFPGLPVAVAFTEWQITLLDSIRKKMIFLEMLLNQINLKNVHILTGRAEEIGQLQQHRQDYDLALIRAVGSASVCAAYAFPLLKIGGLAILYRGHSSQEEKEHLHTALKQLGGQIELIKDFKTPLTNSIRTCYYLRKNTFTPEKLL